MDIGREPKHMLDMYGAEPGKPSFANNCLLARRLVERGVRFVQLFHEAWDQHGNLVHDLKENCKDTDQACAALIKDLKQRGLLDDTLVIWGGEFGRTPMVQRAATTAATIIPTPSPCGWPAAASSRASRYGETDELGFNVRRGQGPRPRPARHDAAPARLRPHQADLPLPGPRLPADGRARRSGEGTARVICAVRPSLFVPHSSFLISPQE